MGKPPFSDDELEDLFSDSEIEQICLVRSRILVGYFTFVAFLGAYYVCSIKTNTTGILALGDLELHLKSVLQ